MIQDGLDTLAAHAHTFTAAAEMLSFAQQRAATHEAQFTGDKSAMAKERRNLLAEWQNIAIREGAMTLFHFAETMDGIALALNDCPTLSAAIDQSRLLTAGRRFRQGFPGFKAARMLHRSLPRRPRRRSASRKAIRPVRSGCTRQRATSSASGRA